ncbi:MAG: hypothetical protein GY887_16115 [Halieaceae bacterium]|nr:hypothetical protein [Halieaceae bacterium]
MDTTNTKTVGQTLNVFENLRSSIAAAKEAQERESAARLSVIEFLTGSGDKSAKLSWANISVVSTHEWKYRDGGVTEAAATVARIEKDLKAAKAVLKGAKDSAQATGGSKAKVIDTKVTLRVAAVKQND